MISHDRFRGEVVLHCLDCDEIALVEDVSEDESEDPESDEPAADHT